MKSSTASEIKRSISHQLVDLTDIFQKISAIYAFARANQSTSFHNPIVFQIVESALHYGVCMSIRRLADGSQKNEVSLFRLVGEIRSNCEHWNRAEFITWDGSPYDSSNLRSEHQREEQRIIHDMIARGETGGWLPIGKHEEVDRRHRIFDLVSGTCNPETRSEHECWQTKLPQYLGRLLQGSAREV